jgi:hypothetical protein
MVTQLPSRLVLSQRVEPLDDVLILFFFGRVAGVVVHVVDFCDVLEWSEIDFN